MTASAHSPAQDRPRVVQVAALSLSARLFLVPLLRALREDGADVTLTCRGDDDGAAAAAEAGVELRPVHIESDIAPWRDLRALAALVRQFRRLRPAVVHAHMSKASLLAMIAARIAGVPVRVYHNHGLAMLSAAGARRSLLRTIERLTCRCATHVLFCGRSTRDAAVEQRLVAPDKARVLGDGTIRGVRTERFDPAVIRARRAALRREWGVGNDEVAFAFVGRLVPHKGIRAMLDAWYLLRGAVGRPAKLLLFGGGDEAFEREVRSDRARDAGVVFLGWRNDIPDCYGAVDALVLASWHEGLPYSVLEAQCAGLPAIVTGVTGNRDAVEHERTGLMVPPHDPPALAAAMERLMNDATLRRTLGENARAHVLAAFPEERVVACWLDFYRGVLGRRV